MPKSCGDRMCATTAVTPTLAKRSNRLLATTQSTPLRTLAESGRESLPEGSESETSLGGGSEVVVIRSQVPQAGANRSQRPGLTRCAYTRRDSNHAPSPAQGCSGTNYQAPPRTRSKPGGLPPSLSFGRSLPDPAPHPGLRGTLDP